MALRDIAKLGEPILRQHAARVPPEKLDSPWLRQLVTDLIDTMHHNQGAGLAAPQIFEPSSVCVLEVEKNPRYPSFPTVPLRVLVNPQVTPLERAELESTRVTIYEGCLSVPGLRGKVDRPRKVHLEAQSLEGAPIDEVWEGIPAAILQHEVDHLNGVLFVDRADPRSLCFLEQFELHVPPSQRVLDGGQTAPAHVPFENQHRDVEEC